VIDAFLLKGKKIFITGASSGIGRATAIACSRMGATLTVSGRNKDNLDETLHLLNGSNHKSEILDITSNDDIKTLFDSLNDKFDSIIHCAGTHKFVPCRYITEENIQKIMSVNFISPIILTRQFLKNKLIKNNGSIIFISSIAANKVSYGTILYSSSKSALNSAMKSFALELAPSKIRVNSVSPGMVKTDFILKNNNSIDQNQLNEDEKKYPFGYGEVEDVANAIVFLVSDAAKWITGTDLILDGGFSLQ